MKAKLNLTVETPKKAGERIANGYDQTTFINLWLARRWLAKQLEKELVVRDRAILQNVKDYIGGTD